MVVLAAAAADRGKFHFMIENYTFGKIKIGDKEYDHDVEVRFSGEVLKWWRETNHLFQLSDAQRAIDAG